MELTRRGFIASAATAVGRAVSTKPPQDKGMAACPQAAARRPTFIGAHHPAHEPGIVKEVVNAPTVFGYIFGHDHVVAEGFLHDGYANSRTVQTATLPSGGFWGDIGYALFRTFEDRAELTFRQTDFYFNRRWPERPRPKNWQERVRMHNGRTVTFWYDKPVNFYCA